MENYCLCGYSVHRGTFLFAVLCLIHGASNIYREHDYFSLVFNNKNDSQLLSIDFVEKYPNYKDYFLIENLVQSIVLVGVSIVLIVAHRCKKPIFYWPFIMYMFFGYIISILRIIFLLTIFIYSSLKNNYGNWTNSQVQNRYEALVILILGLIISAVVHFYIGWVVERGRRFLLNDEEDAKMDDLYSDLSP